MNPIVMFMMLFSAVGLFAWSANRRWQLMKVGRYENRFDRIFERVKMVVTYALGQKKMSYYPLAGAAHRLIFFGFVVLTLRTVIIWARGFDPGFNLFIFGPGLLGDCYAFCKELFELLVLLGVGIFLYYRVVRPQKRMSLHWEGLLILGIIAVQMIADITYDGATEVLRYRALTLGCASPSAELAEQCAHVATIVEHAGPLAPGEQLHFAVWPGPAASVMSLALAEIGTGGLIAIAHAGFWAHAGVVLIFLNLLPFSKHFHVITAIPNAFTANLAPRGRMTPLADNSERLMEIVGAAAEKADSLEDPVGVARIEHFTWKAILDFYTCTECGRCSDNCPAHRSGKILSPKHLTLDLRDHLYSRDDELIARVKSRPGGANAIGQSAEGLSAAATTSSETLVGSSSGDVAAPSGVQTVFNLVPDVIHPDVLWACTTCRACEEQCPVLISYVDKITDMRRNLVLIRGEFPAELQKPFQGMEVNGNPWDLARVDRAVWSEGLDVSLMSDKPRAEVLYWVGCAASYDDRAKRIARATAMLLTRAGVDFAILGQEETCTGDPARRAGNEYLFMMLAEQNAAKLNGYKEQGGVRKIVTACPHCFNTLLNEYPDLGAKFEVVHHSDFLLGLVLEGKLSPMKRVEGKIVFHDSCYLGRYNDVYDPPRELLRRIPGVTLVEASMSRSTGLCCGAGGAQMWMEEQNKDRMNVRRTLQLVETQAKTIASGCPFCQTMLTDGLKSQSLENEIKQLDVAEILLESCPSVPTTARRRDNPSRRV